MPQTASLPYRQACFALLAVAGAPVWSGCGAASAEAPEHEAHHHDAALPSFAEATDALAKLHAELAACWTAARRDDQIEHLLHEIEELLDALPEAAVDSDLPKADWFQLRSGVREWRETLENLESALQADGQAALAAGERYSAEAATAVANLQRLVRMAYPAEEELAPETGSWSPAAPGAETPGAAGADAAD